MAQYLTYQEAKQKYGDKIQSKYCRGITSSQLKTCAMFAFGDLFDRIYFDFDNQNFIVVLNRELDEIVNSKKTGNVIELDESSVNYFEHYFKPTKVIIIKREN